MICEKCKQRDATVHFKEIKNGIKSEKHLCEECAKGEQSIKVDFNIPFSVKDIFPSIMDVDMDNVFTKQSEEICPNCKSTYNRFKNVGRLGCHVCYEAFREQLFPLIKRIQGATQHTGKVPKRAGASIRIKNEIGELKEKLNEAVTKEDFESAARIRDEIKRLEKDI